MAPFSLDLELPPFQPEIMTVYNHANCDFAAFAIYSMVDSSIISDERLYEIANIAQEEWESYSMESQCVKPAVPTANFAGKSLKDVITAHIAIDKDLKPQGGRLFARWWPNAFIVVTKEDIEDHGLLFVYAYEPYEEDKDKNPRMGKFFFKPDDMGKILGDISLSGEDLEYLHEMYDMDRASKADDSDEDGDEL